MSVESQPNKTAAEALEKSAAQGVDGRDRRLATLINTPEWTQFVKVQMFDKPKTWRLVQTLANGEKEEIVFSVQGSLVAKDLPPLVEKPRMNSSKYCYLRQGITISGLGTTTFEDALKSATEVFGAFDRNFREGELESWGPSVGGIDGLEASNRYLTPRRDALGDVGIPFGPGVDPKNILLSMAGEDHIHTEDNEVLYYSRHEDKEGNQVHVSVGPQTFRIGDLVEIQLSFVVVPLKGDKYKMLAVLRSIALLSGQFRQVISAATKPAEAATSTLKRKVRYEERGAVVEGERPGKKGMDIDIGEA
ncbi:hypothetical protein Hypma_013178 [Hypsizygus marmoreus]|uniref:Uncharacterized protein n=1 Tax=Hypsizygus marmoreus TaxID=39966 RepID=A0A369JJZ3_HYPMA|nr:hypothetical protein Hypma_013178 [Hypsizygus marmoreus]